MPEVGAGNSCEEGPGHGSVDVLTIMATHSDFSPLMASLHFEEPRNPSN